MFEASINRISKYDYFAPKFLKAYEFLNRSDLVELPDGAIDLGDGVVAHVQHYTTQPKQFALFETHDKFFDVQYLVRGSELFGLAAREELVPDDLANNRVSQTNDIAFYKDPVYSGEVLLRPGDFIVVSPEEAHKPRCCVGEPASVIKIVIKVPV